MKTNLRLLFLGILICGTLLLSNSVSGQISYFQDFEDWDYGWSADGFYLDTEMSCQGTMSLGGFMYYDPESASQYGATMSPVLTGSNGQLATLNFSYKILMWNDQAVPNVPDWGTLAITYATTTSGPWTVIDIITPGTHTESAECALYTATFTPPAGDIIIRLEAQPNTSGVYNESYLYVDDLSVTQDPSVVCSGTPALSSTVASVPEICLNADVELSLEPYYAESGLVYQWQSSPDGVNYTDLSASGSQTYTATQTASTWYRAIIACENNGEPVISTAVYITTTDIEEPFVGSTTQFYCEPLTVGSLQASVTLEDGNVLWYASETGTDILPEDVQVANGGIYYAAQEYYGCMSPRIAITAIITMPEEPLAQSPQVFEVEDATGIILYDDVEVDAEGIITWYATEEDAESGENSLAQDVEVSEGTFYVTQTINGCESEPTEVEIQTLLDSAGFESGSFTYYPNPVKDILTLSYTEAITHIKVINMFGQKVLDEAPGKNTAVINLSSLANGSYLVRVSAGQTLKTIKVIKQ